MIIVGLDMATKVGYAIMTDGALAETGLIRADAKDKSIAQCDWVEDYGFLVEAKSIARKVVSVVPKKVDFVYIEQTNQGISRTTQKQLEFIHFAVLDGLDAAGHRVSANGNEIKLGPTEYRLLVFLMTHPDRVYGRAQLLDRVWGANVYVEERTVDVHVRRLRKALAAESADTYIQTVRGAGYRFSTRGQ